MGSEPSVHKSGSLSARVVVRITDFVAARGHDAESLCKSAGLALESLRDPEARVPYAVVDELGERAAALVGDPNMGLHLAMEVPNAVRFDPGLLLLMASPSIRAAFGRMERYQRHWGDGQRARLLPADGGMRVRYSMPPPHDRPQRHNDECALAEMVIGIRTLSGANVTPRVVRFRHAAPADTHEHAALFRCPIEWRAEHTEFELADEVLDVPMVHANEAYCAIFEQQVERALARLPSGGIAEDVRATARATLLSGTCSLSRTAKTLGLSTRTLQRRLQLEGTSFGDIVDALRHELALAYLANEVSVQQIAWLLGYTETRAFHEAFKRWTGTTPGQHRARAPKDS